MLQEKLSFTLAATHLIELMMLFVGVTAGNIFIAVL